MSNIVTFCATVSVIVALAVLSDSTDGATTASDVITLANRVIISGQVTGAPVTGCDDLAYAFMGDEFPQWAQKYTVQSSSVDSNGAVTCIVQNSDVADDTATITLYN